MGTTKQTLIAGALGTALVLGSGIKDGKSEQVNKGIDDNKSKVSEVLKHDPMKQLPVDLGTGLKKIEIAGKSGLLLAQLDQEIEKETIQYNLNKNITEIKDILHKKYNDPNISHEDKIFIEKIFNELKNGKNKVSVNFPIRSSNALILDEIGIEVPIEKISGYKDLYKIYSDGLDIFLEGETDTKSKELFNKIITKSKKTFDGLILVSKLNALNIIQSGLKGEKKGINPELNVRVGAIELVAAIDNYINYFEGGKLNRDQLSFNLASYISRFPGVKNIISPERIEFLKQVKTIVMKKYETEVAEKEVKVAEKEKIVTEKEVKVAEKEKIVTEKEELVEKMRFLLKSNT